MRNFKFQISNFKCFRGFSLLEIIVAIAIMGIGFVLIMELFSGSLRSGRVSKDYTAALIYAKGKMDEILIEPKEGTDRGEFEEGYRWESEVILLETQDSGLNLESSSGQEHLQTYKIKVRVFSTRSSGEKKAELVTLKTIPSKE